MVIGDLYEITSVVVQDQNSSIEGTAEVVKKTSKAVYIKPNLEPEQIDYLMGNPVILYALMGNWCYRADLTEVHLVTSKDGALCFQIDTQTEVRSYNRRHYKRYDCSIPCRLQSVKSQITCDGVISDVSEGGICIRSDIDFAVKSAVKVTFTAEGKSLALDVTIVWHEDNGVGISLNERPSWYIAFVGKLRAESNSKVVSV